MTERAFARRSTHADRREAAERRLSRTETLLAELDAVLTATVRSRPQHHEGHDELLRASTRALIGLVARTPDADMIISIGPDHSWALRLCHDGEDLVAQLIHTPAEGLEPLVLDLSPSPERTVADLASLLWAGELGTGSIGIALPPPRLEVGPQ